jgi:hypothetical protein
MPEAISISGAGSLGGEGGMGLRDAGLFYIYIGMLFF